ncbi:Mpped1 [Symbiodinium natans]|uniref:Mpped1 protein n=1 Tax=Symbiodinium natans TaxID=878477 RepID=A0A812JW50_9DINO|nr:Mpped1 [Symbiodinium natans]
MDMDKVGAFACAFAASRSVPVPRGTSSQAGPKRLCKRPAHHGYLARYGSVLAAVAYGARSGCSGQWKRRARPDAEGLDSSKWDSAVRVVAMSDTHGFHRRLRVPAGDVLVHCGDAQCEGQAWKSGFRDFVDWFSAMPFRHKIFVKGNHERGRVWKEALSDCYLRGTRTVGGLKVYGVPYDSEGWYQDALSMQIPDGVDLLISHEPPRDTLDYASASNTRVANIGSTKLKRALGRLGHRQRKGGRRTVPRVHLFGHVHEAHGHKHRHGTLFVNAANANAGRATGLQHACTVIDLATDGSGDVRVVSS